MASLLSPRRTDPEIELRARLAHDEQLPDQLDDGPVPQSGWLWAALAGGLASAAAGWILLTGIAVIGWLAADPGSLVGAIRVGTSLWLLANGAHVGLGSAVVSLIPWGATLLFAFMLSRFAAFAATRGTPPAAGRRCLSVSGLLAAAYAAPVLGVALALNGPAPDGSSGLLRAGLVATSVAGLAGLWGSTRALGCSLTGTWPSWARAIPRAVLGAQLTMLVAGAGALTAALVLHFSRVVELTVSLDAGVAGGIVLLVAQLAYLPNAVVWAASYTLGAGFSLGEGSVVAPASTQLGLLPSVPLFGALPSSGPGQLSELWWLAAGVLAGAVAAWLVVRARPTARFDEMSLVGGLSGLLAGLVFVALAWATRGDLGGSRLAGLGPRLLPLLMLSAATMGLAGTLAGLALGLLRRLPGRSRSWGRPSRSEGEPTQQLIRKEGALRSPDRAADQQTGPEARSGADAEPTVVLGPGRDIGRGD